MVYKGKELYTFTLLAMKIQKLPEGQFGKEISQLLGIGIGKSYTEREEEIIRLRNSGKTQGEVAKILGVSKGLVSLYERKAIRKTVRHHGVLLAIFFGDDVKKIDMSDYTEVINKYEPNPLSWVFEIQIGNPMQNKIFDALRNSWAYNSSPEDIAKKGVMGLRSIRGLSEYAIDLIIGFFREKNIYFYDVRKKMCYKSIETHGNNFKFGLHKSLESSVNFHLGHFFKRKVSVEELATFDLYDLWHIPGIGVRSICVLARLIEANGFEVKDKHKIRERGCYGDMESLLVSLRNQGVPSSIPWVRYEEAISHE